MGSKNTKIARAKSSLVAHARWLYFRLWKRREYKLIKTASGYAEVYSIVDEHGECVRVLEKNGAFQSATYLGSKRFTAPFAYLRSFERAYSSGREPKRALLLGAGGYAWPKHTLSRHAKLCLDVVELDPIITACARQYFFLDELEELAQTRLNIFHADATSFLLESDACYDVIVDDVFDGARACGPSTTDEGCSLLYEHLTQGGLLLANVVVLRGNYSELRERIELLESIFAYVYLLDASDSDFSDDENYLLIASDTPHSFEDDLLN